LESYCLGCGDRNWLPYSLAIAARTALRASSERITLSVRMYVMYPRSYRPWATRITCDDDRRSLRPPSCWRVLVRNGAWGRERYGFSSTLRTAKSAWARPSARALARSSVTTTTSERGVPLASKSLPVATRVPSRTTRSAVNDGAVAVVSSMSQ
jgi:hypothetical protein